MSKTTTTAAKSAPKPVPSPVGAMVDTFCLMTPSGLITNFFTTNPLVYLKDDSVGKVFISSKDSSVKITAITIQGMAGPSATWPADAALITAVGYGPGKLMLSNGAAPMTTPTEFTFDAGGTVVSKCSLNISGLFGTATFTPWGAVRNPDPVGVPAPIIMTPAAGRVNMRIRFTLTPT